MSWLWWNQPEQLNQVWVLGGPLGPGAKEAPQTGGPVPHRGQPQSEIRGYER